MPSFQTIFRAVVMVGVGAVAVEGWRLYGPTNEQLKTLVTQGVDMVQSAIQRSGQATANVPPDPRTATPPAGEDLQPAAPLGRNQPLRSLKRRRRDCSPVSRRSLQRLQISHKLCNPQRTRRRRRQKRIACRN